MPRVLSGRGFVPFEQNPDADASRERWNASLRAIRAFTPVIDGLCEAIQRLCQRPLDYFIVNAPRGDTTEKASAR